MRTASRRPPPFPPIPTPKPARQALAARLATIMSERRETMSAPHRERRHFRTSHWHAIFTRRPAPTPLPPNRADEGPRRALLHSVGLKVVVATAAPALGSQFNSFALSLARPARRRPPELRHSIALGRGGARLQVSSFRLSGWLAGFKF